jgi:hypothetical protein
MTEKSPPYTGRRADWIIIDDPLVIDTSAERMNVIRWFDGTQMRDQPATNLEVYITDDGRLLYLPADIDDGDQDTRL